MTFVTQQTTLTRIGSFTASVIADPNNDGVYDWIIGGHTSPFTTGAVAFNALTLTTSGAIQASFDAAFSNQTHVMSREMLAADFNGDGVDDTFVANTGYDGSPYPGEQDMLFLGTS